MRRLMWCSIGFALACALGAYLDLPWLPGFALLALGLAIFAFFLWRKWKPLRQISAVCLGLSLGLAWFWGYDALYFGTLRKLDGANQIFTATATDYSYTSGYGSAVKAQFRMDNQSYQVLVYINEQLEVEPGDEVSGEFRLRLTHDGKEADTYHRGNGIFLLAYPLSTVQHRKADAIPAQNFPAVMRREITSRIEGAFPSDTAAFAKALMLGDRTDIDYQTNTSFKVSGISHIIAVSGLHISILLSFVLSVMGRRRVLTALIGIPILILFAAVAGFTPSITRACIMQIVMLLALPFEREYDPPTALSFAALVMLVINPMVITSVSFQLSVGCMAGIFLFCQPIQEWVTNFRIWRSWKPKSRWGRLRYTIASGVAVTISAMFFTTPLVAYYFGAVSLVSFVTNLLTLFVISWIFYGIMAVCLLSFVWSQGAAFLAWLISWLIRYVLLVARLLASIPLSAVYTKSGYIVAWIALSYLLVLLFLAIRKKRPFVLVCGIVLSLCLALAASWMEPMTDRFRMTVLDVGQGQCILLQSQGQNFLVDCGGSQDNTATDQAAETLLSMGICRLDGVVLTHFDKDHTGGVADLMSRIQIDRVFLPTDADDPEIRDPIVKLCAARAVAVEEDLTMPLGSGQITIYAPVLNTSDNERSLCVLFSDANCDILITGDLSIQGENRLLLEKDIPELTVLIAGHHGSSGSTGEYLLSRTKPEYVYISVGQDNAYGHPSRELLERLEQHGCHVERTDQSGTIIFRR